MNGRDLKGMPVCNAAGDATGQTVADVILDAIERRVLALHVHGGEAGVEYVLPASDIQDVNGSGVVVAQGGAPIPLADEPMYEAKPTLDSMLDEHVIAEDGTPLGRLADIEIDTDGWRITAYDVVENAAAALEDGAKVIPADTVMAGERTLIVMQGSNPQ